MAGPPPPLPAALRAALALSTASCSRRCLHGAAKPPVAPPDLFPAAASRRRLPQSNKKKAGENGEAAKDGEIVTASSTEAPPAVEMGPTSSAPARVPSTKA